MATYKSALGKTVDMAALVAKNEKVRAVGNLKVNARGDTIDSHGRVVKPVTEKVGESYARTVGNKSANPVKKTPSTASQKLKADTLTESELELENELNDDIDVERIKAQETRK